MPTPRMLTVLLGLAALLTRPAAGVADPVPAAPPVKVVTSLTT